MIIFNVFRCVLKVFWRSILRRLQPVAGGSSIRKGGATATAVRSKSVRLGPVSGLFPVHATGPLNTNNNTMFEEFARCYRLKMKKNYDFLKRHIRWVIFLFIWILSYDMDDHAVASRTLSTSQLKLLFQHEVKPSSIQLIQKMYLFRIQQEQIVMRLGSFVQYVSRYDF